METGLVKSGDRHSPFADRMWNDSRCRECLTLLAVRRNPGVVRDGNEWWVEEVWLPASINTAFAATKVTCKSSFRMTRGLFGFFKGLCGLRQGSSSKCGCLQFSLFLPAPYIGELHFFSVIHTSDGKFTLADEVVVFDVIRQAAIAWKSNVKWPHDLICSRAATGDLNEDSIV